MVQKASRLPTKTDLQLAHELKIKELLGLMRKRVTIQTSGFSGGTPLAGNTPSAGTGQGGTGNFLRTQGDTMIGPIAFFPVPTLKNITFNSINIGPNAANPPDYSTYVLVTGTGDLQFIDGTAWSGQYLILQGTNQQILTIKSARILVAPTIVGDGATQIITVTTTLAHGFSIGEVIQIDQTTNFDRRAPVIATPTANSFTYDLGSIGSATPEAGIARNGNIFTGDGNDIILDGTTTLENAPSITLIFDVTLVGFGGYRVVGGQAGGAAVNEFSDALFRIFDDIDPTRKLAFQVGGVAAATTRTVTIQNADGTMMLIDGVGTQIVVKPTEFRDDIFFIRDNIDSTRKLQFQTGGIGAATTRTWTAQDASGTIPLLDGGAGEQIFTNIIRMNADFDLDGNPLILDVDADSRFITNVDDVLILNLGGTPEFIWTGTSFDITDKFMQITEVTAPATPPGNAVRLFVNPSTGETSVVKDTGLIVSLEAGGAGGAGDGLTFASVIKSTGESVSSSTVFQDDNEIKFLANANKTYAFRYVLFLTHGGGEFKFRWDLPSGATGTVTIDNITSFSATATQDITTSHIVISPGTFSTNVVVFEARVFNGSTGGLVTLQWAQNISDASPSTVLEGSYLRVYEEGATTTAVTGGLTFAKVVKTVDQTVSNSTVLVDDTELFFVGTANKVYQIKMDLWVNNLTASDWKIVFSLPAGATGDWTSQGDFDSRDTDFTADILTERSINGSFAATRHIIIHGRILMGGTTGLCNFRWAQNIAVVEDTKVLRGSTLIVYEEGSEGGGAPSAGVEGVVQILFEQRSPTITVTNRPVSTNPLLLAVFEVVAPSGLTVADALTSFELGDAWMTSRNISGSAGIGFGMIFSDDDQVTWQSEFSAFNNTAIGGAFEEDIGTGPHNTDLGITHVAVATFNAAVAVGEVKELKFKLLFSLPAGYSLNQIL